MIKEIEEITNTPDMDLDSQEFRALTDAYHIWVAGDHVRTRLCEGGLGVKTVLSISQQPQVVMWREDLHLWYWLCIRRAQYYAIGVEDPNIHKRVRIA